MPELLQRIGYFLAEGRLYTVDGLPLIPDDHLVQARRPVVRSTMDMVPGVTQLPDMRLGGAELGEAVLRAALASLNRFARACSRVFAAIDWYAVYASIRVQMLGARKSKVAQFMPPLSAASLSHAEFHAAACSALALQPRKREYVRMGRIMLYSCTSDFGHWIRRGIFPAGSDMMQMPEVYSLSVRFQDDRLEGDIKFVSEIPRLISREDMDYLLTQTMPERHDTGEPSEAWQERLFERDARVSKYGLNWRIRITAVWIPCIFGGRGQFWPVNAFTPIALVRAAFATWRASEDYLKQVREKIASLRERKRAPKRGREPTPGAAEESAKPAKRRKKA